MNQAKVETASKLLAKAESTTSDYEAVALVERAYSLLAQVITEFDESVTGAAGVRRRERRRLQERRRRTRQSPVAAVDQPDRAIDSIDRYRGTIGDGYSRQRGIDVKL
ncbi:MAG TPA: DUF2786 domain-containing protein [Acidimicrobiales bacterium]|nr:DUF2786 domain-containing protein [Acidimicrobiales bacterium]